LSSLVFQINDLDGKAVRGCPEVGFGELILSRFLVSQFAVSWELE